MKGVKLLIYLFVLIPALVLGQNIDSVIIKEIDSLLNLSDELAQDQNFEKALEINAMAEKITLKNIGRESAEYVSCCNYRGNINFYKRDYQEAEKWYLESKKIAESVLGNEHPDYAHCFNNLANLYADLGDYEKAEAMHLEAIKIREKAFGRNHSEFAHSLNNLANLYYDLGSFEKAEELHLQAKEIREKVLGKEHPDYAGTLNNLANLYFEMGEYKKAEPLFLESKAVREKVFGKEHPNFAASLNNLGGFYSKIGNYEKAEVLFQESKAIREKILGKEHPKYAISLLNLANLYSDMKRFEKAEPLFLESIEIWEKSVGKEHPNYLISLISLADLYFEIGRFESAKPIYDQSSSIFKKTLGPEHPLYIVSLYKLAAWNSKMGQYNLADSLYLESMALTQKILGKEHPNYSSCLNNLVVLYESQKMFNKSEILLIELSSLEQQRILKASSFLSEIELANYNSTFGKRLDNIGSYIMNRDLTNSKSSMLTEIFFDNVLFFKGFLLNSILRQEKLATLTPNSREINNELKKHQRSLAVEYAKPFDQRKRIVELEEKVAKTEKALAQLVSGYSEAIQQLKWQELSVRLKLQEAAIEFVHFNINFPNASDSVMYAALLLRPNENRPIFIPLFEERVIDSLLQSKSERRADYVNSLYTLADRGAVVIGTSKKSLYEILWKPIEKELSGIKTIYFSPSGLLHRINLDAIPISQTETLADKYQLIELSSTRQLVIPPPNQNVNDIAVLYGGVHFDLDSATQESESGFASRTNEELSFNKVDSTLRSGTWSYLHGSEKEVNSIQKILMNSGIKTNLKSANEATEEAFKSLGANNISSPRVLHIATHGYFFPDPKTNSKQSEGSNQEESVFKMSDHPMLRSGLILAGGNAAWQGKPTPEGREDGILTAYEISQMNLSNTELVVLSACETGLGDIQGNEGVYGLQRAFKIAGVKYLIMSLWQIPDKQTSMLMISFYKKWLEHKMTIPDAFHSAQKELREIGLDPYQWAGFVLVE